MRKGCPPDIEELRRSVSLLYPLIISARRWLISSLIVRCRSTWTLLHATVSALPAVPALSASQFAHAAALGWGWKRKDHRQKQKGTRRDTKGESYKRGEGARRIKSRRAVHGRGVNKRELPYRATKAGEGKLGQQRKSKKTREGEKEIVCYVRVLCYRERPESA